MLRHLPVAAAVAALTLVSFFQFPGHTFLQGSGGGTDRQGGQTKHDQQAQYSTCHQASP